MEEMVRQIGMANGSVVLVDASDYELVSKRKWHAHGNDRRWTYAAAWNRTTAGKLQLVLMHRILLDPPPGMVVDHINGNTLDNRRCNLRVCEHRENVKNRRKTRGVSRYKGVYWRADRERWVANLRVDGRKINLGRHKDEESAARAYDAAAKVHHGAFARLNFPTQ